MSAPGTMDRRWKNKPCIQCGSPDWMYGRRKLCAGCWESKASTPEALQKLNAQRLSSRAARNGRLTRQPCEVCAKTGHVQSGKSHGHHEDYSKPLEVIWLCPLHHKWVHAYGRDGVFTSSDAEAAQ